MKSMKTIFRNLVAFSAVFLAWFVQSSTANAQYIDTFGFGSREISMGGAMTAESEGASAVHYNPALLTKLKGMYTSFGYTATVPNLSVERMGPVAPALCKKWLECDPFRHAENPDLMQGFQIGAAVPLTKELVAGYVLHMPAKGLASSTILPPDGAYFLDYETGSNTMQTKLAVAYAPFPWISVGVGTTILTNINGSVVQSFPLAAGNPVPAPSGPLTLRQQLDFNWTFNVIGGIYIKPVDFLQLGASYRGPLDSKTHVDLFITSNLNQGGGIDQFIPVSLYSHPVYVPEQASIGGSVKLGSRVTLSGDVTWVNWSEYKPPMAQFFIGQLGSTTFSGVPFPPGSVRIDTVNVPPLHFSDIFVPRVGIEFRPLDWLFLRGGYYFRPSPVPVQAGLTNILDSDTHVFSAGAGIQMDDPLQIIKGKIFFDVHGQYILLASETNTKVSQLSVNDPGNEGLPGYKEGGFLWSLGFTTGIKF